MKLGVHLILVLSCLLSFGQERNKRIYVNAGGVFRTTIFYLHGTKNLSGGPTINFQAPYNYRSGVNGTGLNAAIGYRLLNSIGLNLEWGTTIRYDFYYFNYNCQCNVNTVYVDQMVMLLKSLFKKHYLGIGYTIYNLGREVNYLADMKPKTLPLQFNSLDLFIGANIWKLYFEPKISIVQDNFPGTIKENATLFGARIYYRFNFKKREV